MADNVKTMMYAGETPWHGKGVKLNKEVKSEEAIINAGLNWEVEKRPIFYEQNVNVNIPSLEVIKSKYAIVRKDSNKCLGIVGDVYKPLQNVEAFKFFDSVIGEAKAYYHTAGQLGEGERIWLLAKLPGEMRIIKDDILEKYLLLTNTHNGTCSVMVLITPIRVVCQNTLNIAINTSDNIARIKHSSYITDKMQYVKETLGLINKQYSDFELKAKAMASKLLVPIEVETFLKDVLRTNEQEKQEMSTRAKNILEEVWNIYEHGKGNDIPGTKGTLWAGVNAVVEYADYSKVYRGDNKERELLFGTGQAMKQRAWDIATNMITKK